MNSPKLRFSNNGRAFPEWTKRTFAEAFEFKSNKAISRNQLTYESGQVKSIHYGDILTKLPTVIDSSSVLIPYICEDVVATNLSPLQSGDIILADTAEDLMVGKAVEITVSNNAIVTAGLHTMACHPTNQYAVGFLGYYLNSPSFHSQLNRLVTGTKVLAINKSQIVQTVLLVPSIEEQQKIADFFATLDEKIELIDKKIQLVTTAKTETADRIFSQRLSISKHEWTSSNIKDVLSVERGGSPRPIDKFLTDDPDGLNWIKIGDAPMDGNRITSVKEKILPSGLSKTRAVKKGDLILSNSMSFGRPYILDVDGCIHDGWLAIKNTKGVFDIEFLVYLLASKAVKRQYKSLAGAGVVTNLNKDLVNQVVLTYPCLEDQKEISKILLALDKKLSILKDQSYSLNRLKRGLMQQMFV